MILPYEDLSDMTNKKSRLCCQVKPMICIECHGKAPWCTDHMLPLVTRKYRKALGAGNRYRCSDCAETRAAHKCL